MRAWIFVAALLLPVAALAQTETTITPSGRTVAGGLVVTRADISKALGTKLDLAALAAVQAALAGKADATFVNAVNAAMLQKADNAATAAALASKLDSARLGQPGGVAPLDGSGRVPVDRLGNIITTPIRWTVCATGCTFPTPSAAWATGRGYLFGPYGSISVQIGDGTYDAVDGFFTEEQGTGGISMVGNCTDPGKVLIRFVNIQGNNASGFTALNGGRIGNASVPGVDCMTLRGYGAQVDRQTWVDQSYGAGFFALGSGSNIHVGRKVVLDHFYYSVLADQGGRVVADGASFASAGDVNVLARHGGVVQCLGCTVQTASHIFTNPRGAIETLGFNFMAESGGHLYVDGSSGADAQVACYAAQTAASMWAHDIQASGCQASGARVSQGAFAEFTRARFRNSGQGILVQSDGSASVDQAEIFGNTFDGLHLIGGQAYGNGLRSHDNGSFGVKLEQGSRAALYGAQAGSTNNQAGQVFNETGTPCTTLNAACLPPSSLVIN